METDLALLKRAVRDVVAEHLVWDPLGLGKLKRRACIPTFSCACRRSRKRVISSQRWGESALGGYGTPEVGPDDFAGIAELQRYGGPRTHGAGGRAENSTAEGGGDCIAICSNPTVYHCLS